MVKQKRHEDWLLELTALPTAAGREGRVAAWVRRWAAGRGDVVVTEDKFGNLVLSERERVRGGSGRGGGDGPIYFAAHMDHPAFVVAKDSRGRRVEADFRGWVEESYFKGSSVLLWGEEGVVARGEVRSVKAGVGAGSSRRCVVHLYEKAAARVGDVLTWGVGAARVKGDRLLAPGCDDLAGVAAAVSAFDLLLGDRKRVAGVRVLLTRAEEVGFIGAIGACKAGTVPAGARVIALENSKSFRESPVGAGPIVRVGDRTSTFDPGLTYELGLIAQSLAEGDAGFKWQRKLMPGGTCEATAYQSYGYRAACLCLALGNYHNMNERTGRIDSETISLADYHGLVWLLAAAGRGLEVVGRKSGLQSRLEKRFEEGRGVLGRGSC